MVNPIVCIIVLDVVDEYDDNDRRIEGVDDEPEAENSGMWQQAVAYYFSLFLSCTHSS